MRALMQFGKKIHYALLYLLYYLAASAFIILLFGLFYYFNNVCSPWKLSLEVFWGSEESILPEVYCFIFAEKIINDLFALIFVGKILEKFLKPINPIITSKYAIYDTVKMKFSFRYWIMLSRFEYLYDVKIRVLLTEYETHQRGINQLKPLWELKSDDIQSLDQIRGIRYIELSAEDSQELINTVQKYPNKSWRIDVSIRGNNENGTTYYKWHRYQPKAILIGYRFIPLQRHEYESDYFFSTDPYKTDDDISNFKKREFFRYHYFDKVYQLPYSISFTDKKIRKDILTQNQICRKPFKGISHWGLDTYNLITWYTLDTDRKLFSIIPRQIKRIFSRKSISTK